MTDDLITWLRAQLTIDEGGLRTWLANLPADSGAADWVRQWLAEVDAKRRIVDLVVPGAFGGGYVEAYTDVVKLLAMPYADRPGYCEGWTP